MAELCVLAFLVMLCCAAQAEEPLFGMGRRHYLGEGRLDIKYTTEVATPHIDWADPYVGGAVKVFGVPSVMEGRTLVELMQRLSMELDAVTIDPAWDVNKWTMSFGEAYGARSEQNADGSVDYGFTYQYLEEDLASDRKWDVMVMHGILGWGHLPQRIRETILRRVKEGMGLVLIGPVAEGSALDELRRLSPLTPGPSSPEPMAGDRRHWRVRPGEWQSTGEHYITSGVPLETLPFEYLGHREYVLAAGAAALATADGQPVLAAWEVGKGRVVAFGYQNYGLAPYITWDAYGEIGDAWWETWYSLVIRSLLWAARREPEARVEGLTLSKQSVTTDENAPVHATVGLSGSVPQDARVTWQIRGDAGPVVLQGEAAPVPAQTGNLRHSFSIPIGELAGDSYLVDAFLLAGERRVDWATAPLRVSSPMRVAELAAEPTVVEEGRPVRVAVSLSAPLPESGSLAVELVDNYQRVIAQGRSPVLSADRRTATCTLETGDLLTHIGWVRATLYAGDRRLDRTQVRVDFATPERLRTWDDFEVNVPFYGPQSYYHWLPLLDEQYRRCGVTWLMEPERNYRFTVLARPGGLGVYHYDRKPLDEQMDAYWRTGDRKYLERSPCFHRNWREAARAEIAARVEAYRRYRPFHYYIYDEPSLTSYTRAFEFCFTRETRNAFRDWLMQQYGSLTALNAEWGTAYAGWQQVEPATVEEARAEGRIPAWADFRRFMDLTFADALGFTQQVVGELDPGALTLVGGTQMPTPFNGTDWWLLSHAFGILEPYFGIDQFRSFNPELPIIQACGYQDAGPEFEEELWRRALQGQKGATIFWSYTMLDPDLALNSQGLAMERAFGALRGDGIARLLLGARRDDSRIAMLYSQMSLYAAWLQDGDARSGRSEAADRFWSAQFGWQQALHSLGLQYRCLSYEQLAKEGISRKSLEGGACPARSRGFDALVLPHTLSLSRTEVDAIRRFLGDGGLVLSDVEPGSCDEHCKARPAPALTAADGVHVISSPPADNEFASSAAAQAGPLLDRAGIRPAARAGPGARPRVRAGSPQVVRYLDGAAEYVAVEDAPAEPHRVEFERKAHLYGVRERRYLGEADHVEVPAGQGGVALYALLPSRVREVTVHGPQRIACGDVVSYEVCAAAEAPAFRHVFAVRVYGPDGRLWHMYGSNLDAPTGRATGSFRLALNDPAGEWRMTATDAATGVSGDARFTVGLGGVPSPPAVAGAT